MMEEEKLRLQEEEGSLYQEEKHGSVGESEEEDEHDHAPVKQHPVVTTEGDIPSIKKSVSDLSALSYGMFVEQNKDTGDDNKEDNEVREENLEDEETRELVISPTSQRKVRKAYSLTRLDFGLVCIVKGLQALFENLKSLK